MSDQSAPILSILFIVLRKLRSVIGVAALWSGLMAAGIACFVSLPVRAQEADSKTPPVVVQPGAPGQSTRTLPPSTRATLPPRSSKDVEVMQEMIMHHAQAIEMTEMIESHTANKNIRLLGARISQSQSDEIKFMKRWLEIRKSLFHRRCRTCQLRIRMEAMGRGTRCSCPGCLRQSRLTP